MAEAPREAAPQRVRPMMPEEIRQEEARAQNDILAEVQERDAVNGPDGGKYKIGDDYFDADGNPYKAKKD